jgi:hypothetical protein
MDEPEDCIGCACGEHCIGCEVWEQRKKWLEQSHQGRKRCRKW